MSSRLSASGSCSVAVALVLAWPAVHAQSVLPDAGRTLDSIERVVPQRRVETPGVQIDSPPKGASADDTARIAVTAIRFTGVQAFSPVQMQSLVEEALGKSLTLGEIEALAQRVTRFYRLNDYLVARVYVPAQNVTDGELTLAVLEGAIGQLVLENSSAVRPWVAQAFVKNLPSGAAVLQTPIERSHLLLSDLPGVAAQTRLKPGQVVGSTDIDIALVDTARVQGRFELDNSGNRLTGRARASTLLNLNNPFGLGDQIGLRALSSGSGLNYLRLAYALPVNGHGTRLGLAHAASRYALGREFASLDAQGRARASSVSLTHPVVRSESLNLRLETSLTDKRLTDQINALGTQSVKAVRSSALGLSVDWLDMWLGRSAVSSASLSYNAGRLNLQSLDVAQFDAATARTAGEFGKWTWSATRLQTLAPGWSVYGVAYGQQARKNLDSSEKFVLGGAYGVRAYPEGEAPGDSGSLFSAELRYDPLPQAAAWPALTVFYDHGQVQLNTSPWAGFSGPNTRQLSGYGMGLTWEKTPRWRTQLQLAARAGDEKSTVEPDSGYRVWLRVLREF